MDTMISPTGYYFGSEHGAYYRGAIVGNLFIFVGITAFFLLLALVIFAVKRCFDVKIEYSDGTVLGDLNGALATIHFPSVLIVPTALGFQGTVAASMALFIHSDEGGDIVLGIFGGCVCAIILLYMTALSHKKFFALELRKRHLNESDQTLRGEEKKLSFRQKMGWIFRSEYHWIDPQPETLWKRKYLFLFYDYRFTYFLSLEFLVALILGIVDGIRISDRTVCTWLSALTFIVFFVILMLCLVLKPSLTPFQQGFIIIVNAIGMIGSISLLVGLIEGDESAMELTELLGFIVGICGTLKFLVDLMFAIMWAMETDYIGRMKSSFAKSFRPTAEDMDQLVNDTELDTRAAPTENESSTAAHLLVPTQQTDTLSVAVDPFDNISTHSFTDSLLDPTGASEADLRSGDISNEEPLLGTDLLGPRVEGDKVGAGVDLHNQLRALLNTSHVTADSRNALNMLGQENTRRRRGLSGSSRGSRDPYGGENIEEHGGEVMPLSDDATEEEISSRTLFRGPDKNSKHNLNSTSTSAPAPTAKKRMRRRRSILSITDSDEEDQLLLGECDSRIPMEDDVGSKSSSLPSSSEVKRLNSDDDDFDEFNFL